MFDLSFYNLIKWALNLNKDSDDYKHKAKCAKSVCLQDVKYNRFMILVLELNLKNKNNLETLSIYVEDFLEYFMK